MGEPIFTVPSNSCRRTNTLEHAELGLRAQACFATQNLTLPIATQGVEDVAVDAVENISQTLDTGKPILITGPAACGKSTLTKQYTHRIATKFLQGGGELVPLLVTVIELADTIKAAALGGCSRPFSATDDVLKMHIQRKFGHNQPLVDFLIDRRAAHKLVLVLDGMDNAAEKAYAAHPERLYVVDLAAPGGPTIVFKGGMGPFEYKPEVLRAFLEGLLSPAPPPASSANPFFGESNIFRMGDAPAPVMTMFGGGGGEGG